MLSDILLSIAVLGNCVALLCHLYSHDIKDKR